jgi:phage shock protein PspC (stress-responsive transcriptional regulator)
MKKNISINLQGMIFHVEEDGYEVLSQYLASVKAYFSTYEGHEEIVADIEGRIAEIFASRLSPSKQVITLTDVQALVAQMGSVADFELLNEEDSYTTAGHKGPHTAPGTGTRTGTRAGTRTGKRLFRDESRKMLGGVSSGIALYLGTDPALIRLVFLALFFAGGFGLILYIICWIALPGSSTLPEVTAKRLFRDPDNKMLGGVSSGLGLYFGIDVAIVRLVFLALIFAGGFSILLYILLWVALPEARTITEKVQMHGDPVTLSSIEDSVKRGLNMKDDNGQETPLARLLLLPIRLIAQLIKGLARILGPILLVLFEIVRVVAGILLIIVSTGLIFGVITALFVALGLAQDASVFNIDGMPAAVLFNSVPNVGIWAGFLAGLIPAVFLFILAVGLLTKRFFLRASVGWPLFALWLVSVFTIGSTAAYMAGQFDRSGEFVQEQTFPVAGYSTVVLESIESRYRGLQRPRIEIQSHGGSNVRVIKRFTAEGRTEEMANENAQMVEYKVQQRDSVIRLSGGFEFKPNAVYRNQRLNLVLMLPEGKTFRISRDLAYRLPSETFVRDFSWEEISQNTWQVRNNRFECLTCPPEDTTTVTPTPTSTHWDGSDFRSTGSGLIDLDDYEPNSRTYEMGPFSGIEIDGAYHLRVRKGNTHKVVVRGHREEIDKVRIRVQDHRLVVDDPEQKRRTGKNRALLLDVEVPQLSQIALKGAVKAEMSGIDAPEFRLSQTGAAQSHLSIRSQELYVTLEGASTTTFEGYADFFKVDAEGACHLNAENFRVKSAELRFVGASFADVHVTERIKAHASGLSKISYGGNPTEVMIDNYGPASITRR